MRDTTPKPIASSSQPARILVIETLYLGDLIHTLPLIQAVRRRHPAAQLDLLVRAPHVALMQQVAGVDRVFAMDPKLHRGGRGLWALARQLRQARYDLVLNPGASDRASVLTALSGGAQRIGRLNRKQSRWLWPLLHDHVLDQPWGAEPMYWQKLTAFQNQLQLTDAVGFGLDFSSVDLTGLRLPARYIHISPFASEDIRCIPLATLVELVTVLRQQRPECEVLVTCGPSPRERDRLKCAASALSDLGARLYSGALDLPQLAALIQGAALHIGPDSGPLHLAMAVGTPTAACFLYKNASAEWLPVGPQHRNFGVTTRLEGGLYQLPVSAIVDWALRVV